MISTFAGLVYKGGLKSSRKEKIKRRLTLSIDSYVGITNIKCYQDNKYFVIPRYCIFDENISKYLKGDIVRKIKCNYTKISPNIKYSLLDHQKIIYKFILTNYLTKENIKKGIAGCTVNMPTGHGKTFLAMKLIAHFKRSTLIICPDIKMVNAWEKIIKDNLDIVPGVHHSKKKTKGDILIICVNSVAKMPEPWFDKWYTIVYDEVHNYCSNWRSSFAYSFSNMVNIGLSATCTEKVINKKVDWYCGPIINALEVPGYSKMDANFQGEVDCVYYDGGRDFTQPIIKNGKLNYSETLSRILRDPKRLELIVDYAIKCMENHTVLIFADRISYLLKIKSQLDEKSNKLHTVITGGASESEMKEIENDSNCILTTYQYLGEGKSIPRITSIIFATPRKARLKQYIGRCVRLTKDRELNAKKRYIVDVIDNKSFLRNQWKFRREIYMGLKDSGIDFTLNTI